MSLAQLSSAQWAKPRHTIDTYGDIWGAWQTAGSTATAWGTQYRAVYVPIRVPARVTVLELGWYEGVATGNIDIGIYDSAGTRLVSAGSTAAGSAWESVDVSDTIIGPGLYYAALSSDTAADTYYGFADAAPRPAARGVLTETLANVTLPATATWAVDQTLGFVPLLFVLLVTEL